MGGLTLLSTAGVLPPLFTPLAVSPVYNNNPGFHVVAYDLEAGEIADFASYHADLTGALNAQGSDAVGARSADSPTSRSTAMEPRPVGEFELIAHGAEEAGRPAPPAPSPRLARSLSRATHAPNANATLSWSCGYTARSLWGVPDLSGASVRDLVARLEQDTALLQAFVQNEAARPTSCDSTCLKNQLCVIKHVKKSNVDACQAA